MASAIRHKFKMILFSLILLAGQGYAQTFFEGSLVFEISGGEELQKMKSYSKGGMIRLEPETPGQNFAMIYNKDANELLMLMPDQKMYMSMKMDPAETAEEGTEENNPEIKKTGEKKQILGYTAEKWIIKDEGTETEAWLTDELGGYFFMDNPMGKNKSLGSWENQKELMGKFPLQMIVKNEDGETATINVTDIKKGGVSDDMFKVPADFMKMDIPGMNQGQ
ncbi:MAG TPA: DUF4412 domain-containing protein [Ignavibacteriales bacterium]|nr:DUF4412 domain-containing protein [Ignavibacteriales bacterium]